jgi:F420-non-reducing hydrogenase iron-sulfur subunit
MAERADKGNGFDPKIVAFFCNWCTYLAADSTGVSRKQYPPNIRIIRMLCSGRMDPQFVLDALSKGADGVLIGGCHPGDCHYSEGNYKNLRRYTLLKRMIKEYGIDERRIRLEWISASEGKKLQSVVIDMVDHIKSLGPLDLPGKLENENGEMNSER